MKQDQIVIYQTEDGKTQIDVRLENETVWLTQAQMAELFQKDRTVITRHINNVFKEGELEKEVVCAKFAHTTQHGAIIEHDPKADNNIKSIYKSMCFIKCPPHLFSPTYWKPTEE